MAKLGWGTPTLVSLSLGVIIEIPGEHRHPRRAEGRAARPTTLALIVLQVNFVGAIEFDKQAALLLRRALRLAHPVHHDRRRDGPARRVGRRRQLRRSASAASTRVQPAAAAVPHAAADRDQHPQRADRAHPRRGLLRGHHQHGAVRRARRAVLRLRRCRSKGHLGFDALFQFSPFHFIVEISTSFSVKVFGVGAVQHPTATSRSRARRPGTRTAPARSRCSSSRSRRRLRLHLGRGAGHDPAADRGDAARCTASSTSARTGTRSCRRRSQPARLAAQLDRPDEQRSCCIRSASLQVSQRAVPLDLDARQGRQPEADDANRFTLSVAAAGLAKTRRRRRAVRARAVPGHRRRDEAVASRPSRRRTAGSSCRRPGSRSTSGTRGHAHRPLRARSSSTPASAASRGASGCYPAALFEHFLRGAAVARSRALAARHADELEPFDDKVAVGERRLRRRDPAPTTRRVAPSFTSEAPATEYLAPRSPPTRPSRTTLHVLPRFEVAA